MKDETKNVSLGTSKINYNDPRITVAWCKRHEVRQVPKPLVVTPPHSPPPPPLQLPNRLVGPSAGAHDLD